MKNRLKLLLFVFLISSCEEPEIDKVSDDVELFNGDYWTHDTIKNVLLKSVYENDTVIDLIIYSMDTVKIQEQHYVDGTIECVIEYFESGSKKSFRDYINYQNEGMSLYNVIYFTQFGDTVLNRGFYYTILNSKEYYSLNEPFDLKVELTEREYEDSMRVIVANYDEYFNQSGETIKVTYGNEAFIANVKLPTDKLGENKFRFQIENYKIVNDTLIESKPLFGEYSYIVK